MKKYIIREVERRPYGTYCTFYSVIDTEAEKVSRLGRHCCKGEFHTYEEAKEAIAELEAKEN